MESKVEWKVEGRERERERERDGERVPCGEWRQGGMERAAESGGVGWGLEWGVECGEGRVQCEDWSGEVEWK